MTTFTRLLATAVAALSLATFAQTANAKSIVSVAKSAGSFNTLLTAAKAAGLAGVLSRPGHYTVFAPTDAAFAKLGKKTIRSLLKPRNRHKLRRILSYHVVPRRLRARDFPIGRTPIKTLTGKTVKVRKRGKSVRVNRSRVVKADIRASNGVIHVINRVLLP